LALKHVLLAFLVACPLVAQKTEEAEPLRFADERTKAAISNVKAALLTGRSTSSLRSLRLKGSERITPTVGVPEERPVEFRVLQPDKFLRVQHVSSSVRHVGFNGDLLLNSVFDRKRQIGRTFGARADLDNQRLVAARLMFGLYGSTLRAVPLSASMAEPAATGARRLRFRVAEQDAFEVELGPGNQPAVITYTEKRRLPLDEAPRELTTETLPAPSLVRMTLRLADRRLVDGVMVPFHVIVEGGGKVLEEFKFEGAEINPDLTNADFQRVTK
jgi:hypothetical protein